jgi:hypothetical protein
VLRQYGKSVVLAEGSGAIELRWGGLLDTDGLLIAKIAYDSSSVCFERLCHWSSR